MRHRIPLALVSIVILTLGLTTGQAQDAVREDVLLRTAITREVVDGDYPAAMAIYRKLTGSPDAAIAAEAGTRLAALEAGQQPAQVHVRRLFDRSVGSPGRPSPDGRLMPVIGSDGSLQVLDVSAGTFRRIVPPVTGRSEGINSALFSPDGREVAYAHSNFEQQDAVRIVTVDGTGNRVVFRADPNHHVRPVDWSRDGRELLVISVSSVDPSEEPELLEVTVATGAARRVYSGSFGDAQLTADGSHVVLEDGWDLAILPLSGGSPRPLVRNESNDELVGLAPDERVLFVSDRTGRRGLWALRVQNGQASGEPELIVSDIGQRTPVGVARQGHLYYMESSSSADVYLSELGASGNVQSAPVPIISRFAGANMAPDYSRDGRFLAYVTGRPISSASEIRIRTLETGEERALPKPVRNIVQLRWYPDGRALLVRGGTGGGRGFRRLDIESGTVTTVVERDAGYASVNPTFSPDGRYLYFLDSPSADISALVRLELATGNRQEVLRPSRGILRLYALSPDGTRLAYNWRRDEQDFVYVQPLDGGEPSLIHEVPKSTWSRAFGGLAWTADGRFVLFHRDADNGQGDELLRIPAAGGPAEGLFALGIIRQIAVHPDGRHLAVDARKASSTTYVMEGVLPAATR